MQILVFAAISALGAAYFLFQRRTFDLFVIAFGGGVFYFLPLLIGSVPDWNAEKAAIWRSPPSDRHVCNRQRTYCERGRRGSLV
jgi:hypothetical protein